MSSIDYNKLREAIREAIYTALAVSPDKVVEAFYQGPAPGEYAIAYNVYDVSPAFEGCNCYSCTCVVSIFDSRASSYASGDLVTRLLQLKVFSATNGYKLQVINIDQPPVSTVDEFFHFSLVYEFLVVLP